MTMQTRIIQNGRHRVIIGEHEREAYIATSIDGSSIGGFYTAEQCMEAAGELLAIARRIRKRVG